MNGIPTHPRIIINDADIRINYESGTYFGAPPHIWSDCSRAVNIHNQTQNAIHLAFRNCLDVPISLADQSNVPMIIEPDTGARKLTEKFAFFVVKTYYFDSRKLAESLSRCRQIVEGFGGKHSSYELMTMLKKLGELREANGQYGKVRIDCEYVYPAALFKSGAFYDQRTNLVLTSDGALSLPLHPLSAEFVNVDSGNVKRNEPFNGQALSMIRYINSSPAASPKFVNILGSVYKINPNTGAPRLSELGIKQNVSEMTEYVEVYENTNMPNELGDKSLRFKVYTMTEARQKFGIYDCASDAAALGTPEKQFEHQMRESKERLTVLQASLDEERHTREREELTRKLEHAEHVRKLELEHQREVNKLKLEQDQLKTAQEKLKSELEAKSAGRKDFSEFLKFIAAVILSIGTIVLAILKVYAPQTSNLIPKFIPN